MAEYGPESYGEAFADVYDDWYPNVTAVATCPPPHAGLAGGGRVLELGVGTGRLAVPLAEHCSRGGHCAEVVGVDASPAMLARLADRDPGHTVTAHLVDMATDLPAGPFSLVFVAYNTLFNLVSEAAQASCLALVADRLEPGGRFVVEAFVPVLDGPDRGVEGRPLDDGVVLNVTIRDPTLQVVRGQQVELRNGGVRLRPWQIRYLTPSQLDELASAVGLVRVARWSDWTGSAFGDDSTRHISVYARR